jgi:hypothetical protein
MSTEGVRDNQHSFLEIEEANFGDELAIVDLFVWPAETVQSWSEIRVDMSEVVLEFAVIHHGSTAT